MEGNYETESAEWTNREVHSGVCGRKLFILHKMETNIEKLEDEAGVLKEIVTERGLSEFITTYFNNNYSFGFFERHK